MADLLRQVLRVNRLFAGFGEIVEALTRIAIIAQRLVEEFTLGFLFHQRQQRRQRGFDITDQRHIDLTVRADAAGIDINLDNFGVSWVERAVGELRTEEHQRIGIHHGMEA